MKERFWLFIILLLSVSALLIQTQTLSISADEAEIYFHGDSIAHYFANLSTHFLGQNDLALRLPFIFFHLLSVILLYKIGKIFLKRYFDRIFSVAIYALLPGVNSAALIVNNGSIIIFVTLFFTYCYLKEYKVASHALLIVSLFVDNSFAILYIALFVYALMQKKYDLVTLTIVLFSASMYLYGFDTGGKPKGYFMDTLGVYTAVFSPLLFLYFIYAMYRILIKEEKNLLWYISFISLIVSLILSLRQRLQLEDFAPYVVLSIPLMVKVYLNSYRVRLPQFRKWHTMLFGVVISTLILNTIAIFLSKPLYLLLENPHRNFAMKYHIAKELAQALHAKGMINVRTNDEGLALRLKFYGITQGGMYKLSLKQEIPEGFEIIDVSYYHKTIKRFYLYEIG